MQVVCQEQRARESPRPQAAVRRVRAVEGQTAAPDRSVPEVPGRAQRTDRRIQEAWTEANAARTAASKREHYERNREEIIARSEEWGKNNAEKVRRFKANNNRVRRAVKHASLGNFTAKEFEDLCERCGNRCLCCGVTGIVLEADHVVPLTRGGSDGIGNIQPLCGTCNRSKFVRTVDYRTDRHNPSEPPDLLREACGLYHLRLDEVLVEEADL